ncbi:transposase [Nocardia farcinica]|uniref:transposase n=1 Tax=Nocardia farcinica TaxID=37329 RepID=UPI002804A49B|nr:transposase [Nocardia farcinica]
MVDELSKRLVPGELWENRLLGSVYPVVFLDAIHVKIREGKVANRPIYVVLAVTVEGTRDFWACGLETVVRGWSFWREILTELKNRGAEDVCVVHAHLQRSRRSA